MPPPPRRRRRHWRERDVDATLRVLHLFDELIHMREALRSVGVCGVFCTVFFVGWMCPSAVGYV